MTTCGEAIPKLLAGYGCEVVFGIPGTHSIELYRGLGDGTLRHVLPRHEQGAAFMAEGYARLAGKPALCCLITGPGLTNGATGIAQAYASSTPMLVITPVNERESLGKGWGRLHELTDQSAVVRPFTAFTETAMTASDVPALVARAYDIFSSQRPRPCHIQIPIDVMREPATGDWSPRAPAMARTPDPQAITTAARLLLEARSPVILAGGGAIGAAEAVRRLAERLDAPVATSFAGKGILPHTHPLALGATLSLVGTQAALAVADVVLAVGTELSETDSWRKWLDIPGRIVRVDIDEGEISSDYPSAVAIEGDAATAIVMLMEAIGRGGPGEPPRAGHGQERAAAARLANRATLDSLQRRHLTVLDAMRASLPAETVFVGDMTQLAYTADRFLDVDRPGHYLGSFGYGTLGYALPTALGAKIAAPDRPVAAIAGDSGVLYTIQEMATAVEERLGVILYLWNNRALGQIRDDMVEAQIRPFAVLPEPPDFQAIARGFGWQSAIAHDAGEIGALTAAALAAGGPHLIEVRDPEVWAHD